LKKNIGEIWRIFGDKKEKKECSGGENYQKDLYQEKLYKWTDKKYNKEYWTRLEKNWRQ